MRKKWTTLEEAEAQYTAYTGEMPEVSCIINLYHRYRNECQHFKNFLEWLIYHS